MAFDIVANVQQFQRALDAHEKAAGFAEVVALTRTARATAQFARDEATRVFDRPRPFTVNSPYWRPAAADRKVFEVGIKDFAGKGTPASKYLRPQIEGGQRRQKRSEVAIIRSGRYADALGNRAYWVPAPGLKLDRYGNVPASMIVRILSDIMAAETRAGYQANRTDRSVKRNKRYRAERFFVPTTASGLAPGVWVERKGRISPVLLFVTEATYKPRYDFINGGMKFARQRFPEEMAQALREGWHLPRSTQKALGYARTRI